MKLKTILESHKDATLTDELIAQILEEAKPKRTSAAVKFVKGSADVEKLKLNAQLRKISEVLSNEPMTLDEIGDLAVKAGMETKQKPGQVVKFYKQRLIESGVIAFAPKQDEKAEKPKAQPKRRAAKKEAEAA